MAGSLSAEGAVTAGGLTTAAPMPVAPIPAALGNVLVQARRLVWTPVTWTGCARLIRATQPLRRFEPAGDPRAWAAAARRS